MTEPTRLRLYLLDIPVEGGMVERTPQASIALGYQIGLDERRTLWLIYRAPGDQPRVSVYDPHWTPNHGLRYVTWLTSP